MKDSTDGIGILKWETEHDKYISGRQLVSGNTLRVG